MKQKAAAFGINPCFIPVGFIDDLQPSEAGVFGASEAIWRRMYQRFVAVVSGTVRKPNAIELTCRAWTEVKEKVIRKAWKIYAEPDD
jgi:hypothetical protein